MIIVQCKVKRSIVMNYGKQLYAIKTHYAKWSKILDVNTPRKVSLLHARREIVLVNVWRKWTHVDTHPHLTPLYHEWMDVLRDQGHLCCVLTRIILWVNLYRNLYSLMSLSSFRAVILRIHGTNYEHCTNPTKIIKTLKSHYARFSQILVQSCWNKLQTSFGSSYVRSSWITDCFLPERKS